MLGLGDMVRRLLFIEALAQGAGWLLAGLALLGCVLGCGSAVATPSSGDATVGDSSIPLGTYAHCTTLAQSSGMGGSLTLAQKGSSLVATYAGPDFKGSLDFVATSETSATLSPPGQRLPGSWSWCGGGVLDGGGIADPVPTASTLDIESGAVTYDAETVFLTFVGTVEPPDGEADCSKGTQVATIACSKE